MAVCVEWRDTHVGAPVPRVGVAVLLCRDNRVLVCRRRSETSYDHHALPGGFLEFGETLEECAIREMEEETGLAIQNIQFGSVVNTILMDELRPSHYLTVFMKAELDDSTKEPTTLEPEKCGGWLWVEWPNVPDPVYKPLQDLLDTNYDPFKQRHGRYGTSED